MPSHLDALRIAVLVVAFAVLACLVMFTALPIVGLIIGAVVGPLAVVFVDRRRRRQ